MIRIVWGSAHGETAGAAFDAALYEANVHKYNLRQLSSVIPADTPIDVSGRFPDIGNPGEQLFVAMSKQTAGPDESAVAGIGWAREKNVGSGVFAEIGGTDQTQIADELVKTVEHGCKLRGIQSPDINTKVIHTDKQKELYSTAVVLATYGTSTPLTES